MTDPSGAPAQAVVDTLRAAGCVFAEDEAALLREAAADDAGKLDALVRRRCAGEPLELVLGWAEFGGLRIAVEPGVFVPRHRTTALVDRAVGLLATRRGTSHPVVVDLGCGSGAIMVALLGRTGCRAYAIDPSPAAVACSRRNLDGTEAVVLEGDGLDALPAELASRIDVVVANLPYVPSDAVPLLPREARLYEPLSTLDGGRDGLDPLRIALAAGARWLAPDGHHVGEVHASQLAEVERIASRLGLAVDAVTDPDDATTIVDLHRR